MVRKNRPKKVALVMSIFDICDGQQPSEFRFDLLRPCGRHGGKRHPSQAAGQSVHCTWRFREAHNQRLKHVTGVLLARRPYPTE